jgi:FkbM family methyltransferase
MINKLILKLINSNSVVGKLFRKFTLINLNLKPSVWLFNQFYNNLDFENKAVIHSIFAKHYRTGNKNIAANNWEIVFNGNKLLMPLKKSRLWLDWDSALSVVGHDIDIKNTYEYLLNNIQINCFFDVGANYCTHSLLFLRNNVSTYSFEPNIICSEYFKDCLEINNLKGNFINMAIGNEKGQVELTFPENDTWLGTISAKENDFVSKFENLTKVKVEINTLDNYSKINNLHPELIKIDTEGFEIEVLNGASEILQTIQPIIILEANDIDKRGELYAFLDKSSYGIFNLLDDNKEFCHLNLNAFVENKKNNFIAFPNNHHFLNK